MKLVFMGTPDFSAGTLESLIKAGHEVAAVVTQPDKPKGRGKAVLYTPVKEKAMAYHIPVYQPEKVRTPEFTAILREIAPELIVVAAFGQILSKEILELPRYGCINVHASLLPKYRGAAPIQQAVIDGEDVSGITIMQMDEGLDTGDMLMKTVVALDRKETGGSLHDKLSAAGAALCVQAVEKLESGVLIPQKQDDSQSTYVKMLKKSMGSIDWSMSAEAVERLIRGLNPWPSAFTRLKGKTLKIWEADVEDIDSPQKPGTIVQAEEDVIKVQTGKGLLVIRELQLEGKKRMKTDAFLRGVTVETGTVLEQA